MESGAGFYSNGVLIFDYQSPTNFKFAGAYAGGNKWVIGYRTNSWTTVATSLETIYANTDYDFQLVIESQSVVTLSVNGSAKLTHTFGGSLTDGAVGLGTWNAIAHFDNVVVQEYSVGVTTVGFNAAPSSKTSFVTDDLVVSPNASQSSKRGMADRRDAVFKADLVRPRNSRSTSTKEMTLLSPATSTLDRVFADLDNNRAIHSAFDLNGAALEDLGEIWWSFE